MPSEVEARRGHQNPSRAGNGARCVADTCQECDRRRRQVPAWAGATAGVAVIGGALSVASWYKTLAICREWDIDSPRCSVSGQPVKQATTSDLQNAESQLTLYGNQLAKYGGIASGLIGAVSIVLFSANAVAGLGSGTNGGGGDQVPATRVGRTIVEPEPAGLVLRF
jgi:hypothetical protein